MVIHYIYKIYFLCEEDGAYYIGKRTYRGRNIDLDSYRGSGKYCDYYFNKYGTVLGVTYTKEILEIIQVPDIIEISRGQMIFVFVSSTNYCGRTKNGCIKGSRIINENYYFLGISQL